MENSPDHYKQEYRQKEIIFISSPQLGERTILILFLQSVFWLFQQLVAITLPKTRRRRE